MEVHFRPSWKILDDSIDYANGAKIEKEPMIYGGSWDWSWVNGGALTRHVMERIEGDVRQEAIKHSLKGYHPVIDTKSVNLMPGQYPCIPGWHCDGVIRADQHSQPDLSTLADDIKHYTCCIAENKDIPGTEFTTNPINLTVDPDHVWASVDEQMKVYRGKNAKSCQIIKFSRGDLHRGPAAENRGWRYFFRLSFYHMPAMNRLRNQVQIYTDINQGW